MNRILAAGIRSFFDRMIHEWTVTFMEHRIADTRIIRLIQKWLKAGGSDDGEWSKTTVGTPRGAVILPLLAKRVPALRIRPVAGSMARPGGRRSGGGGEHGREAERFLAEFQERLAEYGLEMHPDKTRMIEFGRWARDNRRQPAEGEPESFVFLGFTYSCRTNGAGDFTIWPRSVRRRVESKLQAVKQTLCPDA